MPIATQRRPLPVGSVSLSQPEKTIRIMCPNLSCQRILAVPPEARGKIVRCSACGINVRIPQPKDGEASAPKDAV